MAPEFAGSDDEIVGMCRNQGRGRGTIGKYFLHHRLCLRGPDIPLLGFCWHVVGRSSCRKKAFGGIEAFCYDSLLKSCR